MTVINRSYDRGLYDLRHLTIERGFMPHAEGSCLVSLGETRVIVTASIDDSIPKWRRDSGNGWITAEYGMLPRATDTRNRRPQTSSHISGRTMEIQRLVGRSLRAVCDLEALGERTIHIDCDVINADGGTRVTSIIGAAVSLADAEQLLLENGDIKKKFMRELVSAVSVGIIGGVTIGDLDYSEDSSADVDMNVVMTEGGDFIEIQGTGEHDTFSRKQTLELLDLASTLCSEILLKQKTSLNL